MWSGSLSQAPMKELAIGQRGPATRACMVLPAAAAAGRQGVVL